MSKSFTYQQKVITTPRGQNVGQNILNNLISTGLYNHIDIKTVNTERDPINKAQITTLEYTYKRS